MNEVAASALLSESRIKRMKQIPLIKKGSHRLPSVFSSKFLVEQDHSASGRTILLKDQIISAELAFPPR